MSLSFSKMTGKKKSKLIGGSTLSNQLARIRTASSSVDENSDSSSTFPTPIASEKTETDLKSEKLTVDLSLVKVEKTIWEVPEPTVMLDITGSTTIVP